MPRPYYTLFTHESGQWLPQFGDHCRATVVQEREDTYLARWRNDEFRYTSRCIKILTLPNATQRAVDEATARLNKEGQP